VAQTPLICVIAHFRAIFLSPQRVCAITQMSSRIDITAQRLGARVREERRRQAMDQRTLALVANVAVRSVHRVEHGEPTVRLDVVLRILAALGLRLDVRGGGER
jgi:ribosome-binding protein aMBF1 (putative translation factor)